MSYKDLFAEEGAEDDGGYAALAHFIINEGRRQGATVLPPVVLHVGGQDDREAQMEQYDRELFEGLFLRYGKAWVNEQMALLIRKFPSYKQG